MRLGLVVAVVCVLSILAGCAAGPPPPPPSSNRPQKSLVPPFDGAPTLPAPDMTNDGPGSLVQVTPLSGISIFDAANATAVRVVYRSTSSDGRPTEVSGVVAVPPGKTPKGGWPIVSFGHSLTGLATTCAPSQAKDVGGYAATLRTLLQHGYVVTMSDYEGLGVTGYQHAALDWVTLGNNIIDAARAVRRVLPDASANWAAEGVGQGGLAAWAAAKRAQEYGAGLTMVGAVAFSPFADLSPLVDNAENGTLSEAQRRLLMVVLQSLAQSDPGFDLDAYRSAFAKDQWDTLTDCAPADPAAARKAAAQLKPADLMPRDDAAAVDLRNILSAKALPAGGGKAAVPVLVVYASDDPLVPQAGILRALQNACANANPIVAMKLIGDSSAADFQTVQTALGWLRSRFDGERPADVCVGLW